MKIVVIDHVGNCGGGSRFTRALLIALAKNYPEIEILFYGNSRSLKRENLLAEITNKNIKIKKLNSFLMKFILKEKVKNHFLLKKFPFLFLAVNFFNKVVILKFKKIFSKGDLVFLLWPYFFPAIEREKPLIGVFHDFNYKYFFGSQIFSKDALSFLDREIPKLIEKSTPIVSTYFMKKELEKFYPQFAEKTQVIHLAPFSIEEIHEEERMLVLKKFNITKPYILCPTNLTYHKNINSLLTAMYYLKQKGYSIQLIITGPHTETIKGVSSEIGLERNNDVFDVIGLGYVTNKEIAALIKSAKIVINTSLYEAGNGSGLDAWSLGIPVAMSDIPAFREHVDFQGMKAQIFDPKNPKDIADKLAYILDHYESALEDAQVSKEKIKKITWEKVAEEYFQVFKKTISEGKNV